MGKSSTPPVVFDILGVLLQLCLLITRPYEFLLVMPMIPFKGFMKSNRVTDSDVKKDITKYLTNSAKRKDITDN